MNKEWLKNLKHFYLHNSEVLSPEFISHMDKFMIENKVPEDGSLFENEKIFEHFIKWEHDSIQNGSIKVSDDNINALRGIADSMQKDRELKDMDTSIIDEFSNTFKTLAEDSNNYIETDAELQKIFERYVSAKGKAISNVLSAAAQSATGEDIFKLSAEELKVKLNSMSSSEITETIVKQMEKTNFDDILQRQEFFKNISGYRSNHYSLRNLMILQMQAKQRGLLSVFGTFKEFNAKGWPVAAGEKGMFICIPNRFDIYYDLNEDGSWNIMPRPVSKKQLEDYNKKVANNELNKKECISFRYLANIFSLTQTTIPEEERNKLIQRYNTHNTSEENIGILSKLEEVTSKLGIKFIDVNRKIEATGFIDYSHKVMYVKKDMPVDAKISVICHELGHYFLHRDSDNFPKQYKLDHKNRELQAELFSHIALESLGVDSESESSINYLKGYLPDTDRFIGTLESYKKDVLYCHTSIVRDLAIKLKDVVSQDIIDDSSIKSLEDFKPDFFTQNKFTQRAFMITRREFEQEQHNDVMDKVKGNVKNQSKAMVMERGE